MVRLLGAISILLAAGPALAQPADTAGGLALAQKLCSGCHLVSARPQGPVPDGVPSFMAIAARPGMDATRIESTLIQPKHPAMPAPPLVSGSDTPSILRARLHGAPDPPC